MVRIPLLLLFVSAACTGAGEISGEHDEQDDVAQEQIQYIEDVPGAMYVKRPEGSETNELPAAFMAMMGGNSASMVKSFGEASRTATATKPKKDGHQIAFEFIERTTQRKDSDGRVIKNGVPTRDWMAVWLKRYFDTKGDDDDAVVTRSLPRDWVNGRSSNIRSAK